jgi:hypothetical protein
MARPRFLETLPLSSPDPYQKKTTAKERLPFKSDPGHFLCEIHLSERPRGVSALKIWSYGHCAALDSLQALLAKVLSLIDNCRAARGKGGPKNDSSSSTITGSSE